VKKNFINTGVKDFGVILNPKKCKDLKTQIEKFRGYHKNIFYKSYKEYKKSGRISNTSPGLKTHNLIYTHNLDLKFVDESFKFKNALSSIMGNEFRIIKRSVIMHVPLKLIPRWIKEKVKNVGRANLNPWIKDEYQDVQYFSHLDFHQDMSKAISGYDKFATFSINLDKVTAKDGPIQILENSQILGRTFYPHFVRQSAHEDNIWYYSNLEGDHIKSKNRIVTGPAGKVFGFHGLVLHGTSFNQSLKPRVSLRYLVSSKKSQFKKTIWGKSFKKIKGSIKGLSNLHARLDINKDGSYKDTGMSIR